jgi:hypothetical protein
MGRTVILNEEVNTACDIAGTSRNDSNKTPFVLKTMRHLPTQGRSATLWMAAAMLAMTWMSETQAFPDQARHLADAQHAAAARNLDSDGTAGDGEFEALPPSRGSNDKSGQVAQATTSDTGAPQQSPEQEHHGAETLSCEVTIARRDIELLQHLGQEHDRAERLELDLAAARRDVETQTALTAKAVEETARVKQAAQSGAAELQNSLQQERERAEQLEQDLAAARRDVETQTALTAEAVEETVRVKQAAQSGAAELQKSLQQERERAERLEQDLAAARRDLETQTALAGKAGDESSRLKQSAESEVAELRRSMQKEHDRAEALAHDLSLARSEIYAYQAQASKAGDEAAELREQADASPASASRKSAQDARDRAERLEQDLATARRDLETQAALAAKASEEAARARQTAERDSAALRSSLQQERARAERLERNLALAQRVAPNVVTIGPIARDKPVEEGANPIADRAPAAGARGDAQPNSEEAAVAAGLVARASALLRQGDIGAARIVLERAVEMGSAQASFSLAETYDPLILAKWGTYGTRGDAIKAQDLYANADAAGIQEAKARFEALRR